MTYTLVTAVILLAIAVLMHTISATSVFGANGDTASATRSYKTDTNLQRLAVASPSQTSQKPSTPIGGGGVQLSGDAAVIAPHGPSTEKLSKSSINTENKRASIYSVRSGDTLTEIAELFDVSVNTIIWANDLEGKSIAPGDTLIILPVSGVRHEVEEGETVSELADRYGVATEKIRDYNELEDEENLAVGAILDIPGGEMPDRSTQSSSPQQNMTVQNQRTAQANTGPAARGYFTHPVPQSTKTQGRHGYNAVDLGAPVGTPIVASASGNVEKSVGAGWNGGYGKFIVVRHDNGTKTLYSHLSSTLVGRGQRVVQGEVIGYVGNTGRSTGPHLHFEVRGAQNPF